MSAKLHRCVMASTGLSPPSEPRSRSTPNRDSEPDDPDLAMVPAAMSTVRTSTPQRAAQTRPSSPPSGLFVSEPTSSEASPAIQFPSQGSQLPDPMTNVPAAAFIAGAAVQQAHRASDLAAQAANHALHQQQAADQARQEAGWIRERAVREVSDVRVQAAQLASQAQQAVQTAQQSEAQARQLIEQTRQEAIGHVENARQVVNATQQDAQQEVQRIVQEAQQAISQREQTIASQEHTIRGLSQENSVMHQRLGDLERVVAHLTQQARATPVPIQESPPKAASIAETATETSAAKASSQGTVPPRTHQPVGAPQVSESQDASGVAASSQGNAFISTIPDPPCGSVQSSGLGHDAPADSRDLGGGATSQHLAGHSAVLGAASSVGDAAPGASRTSGLGRDGARDQADVRVQVTGLAEMEFAGAPPPPKAGDGTRVPPVPITMLGGLYSSSPQAPSAASSDSSSDSDGNDDTPQCRVCGGSHEDTDCPYLTMNGGGGGGGGSGQFPNADPFQAVDPSVGMTAVDHAAYEESVVRVKDLKDLVLPSPPENAGQARGFVNQVLMAIGRLQKTPGDEVYQWAQGSSRPAAKVSSGSCFKTWLNKRESRQVGCP